MAPLNGSAVQAKMGDVLISYSRHDASELRQLRKVLAPLVYDRGLKLWVDEDMPPGVEWPVELNNALEACSVGVLLVTADYLASSFIRTRELGPLLEAHAKGEKALVWVAVGHCRYEDTQLGRILAANNPDKPIKSLPLAEQAQAWVEVSRKIEAAALGLTNTEPATPPLAQTPAPPAPTAPSGIPGPPPGTTVVATAANHGIATAVGPGSIVNIGVIGQGQNGSGAS